MTSFTARAQLAHPALRAIAGSVVGALDGFHPVAGRTDTGHLQITFTYDAADLRTALQLGMGVMLANGWNPTAIEVMATDAYDQQGERVPIPELVSVDEAAALLRIDPPEVEDRIQQGLLPARPVGSTYAIARSALPHSKQSQTPMQLAQLRIGRVHDELTGHSDRH